VKIWRVISTSADGKGTGEQFQDRWRAEEAFNGALEPGKLVTLAEFQDNKMVEIVRDSRWEGNKNDRG